MMIRPAQASDAEDMANLLNVIIAKGGTTAYQSPWDSDRILAHYVRDNSLISCHVAEEYGRICGFQGLWHPHDPQDPMPEGWAVIASFVADGHAGKGIGGKLFNATLMAARAAGTRVIDATIRADNHSGLGYYGALGFVDYDVLRSVPLRDGTLVDRIRKRFDL